MFLVVTLIDVVGSDYLDARLLRDHSSSAQFAFRPIQNVETPQLIPLFRGG